MEELLTTVTRAQIGDTARAERLEVLGTVRPAPDDAVPGRTESVVLLGPAEPGFWPHVTQAPEFADGSPDPLDRWSSRIIGAMADKLGATPLFPFGGPPYLPFIAWALRSGQAWQSPVGLLVHDRAGLMVSYRGALAFGHVIEDTDGSECPCAACADQPCLAACPPAALTRDGYDVATCHDFLDSEAGTECLAAGCLVRRSCPVSQGYGRQPDQSGFHMAAFHR